MLTEREMDTKVCSQCKEVKTLDGFNKAKRNKSGYRSECKACVKEYQVEYYAANPEKDRERQAKYYAANPEKGRERNAKYYAANPEKVKERGAEWTKANPEKVKEIQAKYRAANPEKKKKCSAEWARANPEKCRAKSSKRRAAKLEAIPSWLTEEDWQVMEDIGKEADRLTRETGIKYEVDHIHPLRGKLICGLQCPTNLQILTKSQNCSKRNKFTPYVESELTY